MLARLTRLEFMLFLREPIGTFFTIVFPLILLLTIGAAFGDSKLDNGEYQYIDIYVPALFAMIISNLGLMSIPIVLGEYRDSGYLKTLFATPLRRSTLIASQSIAHAILFLAGALLVLVVGVLVFGLKFGGSVPAIAAFLILGAVAFFASGHLLSAMFTSVRSAQAVGSVVFFIMLFLSGAAIPRDQFPGWLDTFGSLLPVAQMIDPMTDIWTGEPVADQWPHAIYLLVMSVLVVGGTVAIQRRRDL